jgi:hypothetical protein
MAIRSEVTLDTTKARGEARRASAEIAKSMSSAAVSYTHLTLPTSP